LQDLVENNNTYTQLSTSMFDKKEHAIFNLSYIEELKDYIFSYINNF